MLQNKLVESWLDNQGERRYQPALIQLLISEGWTVLHNTRHGPLEFGKDVIARDPDGKICALQLKGNPGSRLTKGEAQTLIPQFIEAMEVEIPTSYGRKPSERHKTIIVTNGEIEEESRVLFDRVAERVKNTLCPSDSVEYWARGDLLSRFSRKIEAIWPVTVIGLTQAIRVFGEDGLANPKPGQIAAVLEAAFGQAHAKMKAAEKSAKITSIFLLTEILKSPWYKTLNHYGLYCITVLAAVYALQFADAKNRNRLIEDYAPLALQHAQNLIREAIEKDYDPQYNWAVTSPFGEVDIFIERARLIAEVASALVISGVVSDPEKTDFRRLISGSFMPGALWGQFVVPSMIVRHLAWRKVDATAAPDWSLGSLLSGYLMAASDHRLPDRITNAAPYYTFEDVLYVQTNGAFGTKSSVKMDDTRNHLSFGKALMYILALKNMKQTCKSLWRSYSRMMHGSTEVDFSSYFSPSLSYNGSITSQQYYSQEWINLVQEAIEASQSEKFDAFNGLNWLAAAYLCIAPHRAEHSVIMALHAAESSSWYGKHHRPEDPVL